MVTSIPEGFTRDGPCVHANSAKHGALVDDAHGLAVLDRFEGTHLRGRA